MGAARAVSAALGAACIAAGLSRATALQDSGYATLAIVGGAVLLVGGLFERVRYKPIDGPRPGPGWEPTAERVIDPPTGRLLAVWWNPSTGDRCYLPWNGDGQ
jgi:hypothetical protein